MPKHTLRAEPTVCDTCGSVNIKLTTKENNPRLWPYLWACECGAEVGCHSGTHSPLGFMANKSTRRLRAEVHHSLDRIWKSGYIQRARIYVWLAAQLELSEPDCHISELTMDQLKQALDVLERFITEHGQRIKRKEQGNGRGTTKTRTDNSTNRGRQTRNRSTRYGRRQA